MIIYIYGEDTFRSRNYLKQQVERFKKERDPQGMNVVVLDGQKDGDRIWSEIMATPFLAEKRMIVIQNVLSNKDQEVLESLIEGIKAKKIPEMNVVIFWQGEPVGKSKVAKELQDILAKEKWAMQFENLIGFKLSAWIKEEVFKRGGAINSAAVAYLAQNVGQDTWYVDSLMDQLVAYAAPTTPSPLLGQEGKREITLADVQLFLEEKVDDSMFNMVDAIVVGNRKLAFKLVEEQRRLGEEDGHIFGMILRQFRILISMRDLFNRQENITSDTMAKMLDLHPFVVKKSLPLLQRRASNDGARHDFVKSKYSLDKLKDIYQQLLEIDIKTKTGQADQSLLIDLFVGKLS